MREKLIELIQSAVNGCATYWAGLIADYLIANGVIVLDEKDVTLTVTRNVGEIEPDYEAEDV